MLGFHGDHAAEPGSPELRPTALSAAPPNTRQDLIGGDEWHSNSHDVFWFPNSHMLSLERTWTRADGQQPSQRHNRVDQLVTNLWKCEIEPCSFITSNKSKWFQWLMNIVNNLLIKSNTVTLIYTYTHRHTYTYRYTYIYISIPIRSRYAQHLLTLKTPCHYASIYKLCTGSTVQFRFIEGSLK